MCSWIAVQAEFMFCGLWVERFWDEMPMEGSCRDDGANFRALGNFQILGTLYKSHGAGSKFMDSA